MNFVNSDTVLLDNEDKDLIIKNLKIGILETLINKASLRPDNIDLSRNFKEVNYGIEKREEDTISKQFFVDVSCYYEDDFKVELEQQIIVEVWFKPELAYHGIYNIFKVDIVSNIKNLMISDNL